VEVALLCILLLGAYDSSGVYARPKAYKSEAGTTLDYNRRECAPDPRCMHAFLGQDAQLPEWEVSGVDTTEHHILGLEMALILPQRIAWNRKIELCPRGYGSSTKLTSKNDDKCPI
jgi:hypothetical protein